MPFAKRVRAQLVERLGAAHVKDDPATLYVYRCDALTLHGGAPMGVIFPGSAEELAWAVALFNREGIPFLPRGAGTGLSGGAIPGEGAVVVEMDRFRQIGPVDTVNRTIEVGPGVVNIEVSRQAEPHGLRFTPDPSSQKVSSIGGNVGENAGGPHTLKHGVTVNHVLGVDAVLADGSAVRLGGEAFGRPGPDLTGLFVGSEGTFGIVASVNCRLTPLPEKVATMLAAFHSVADASQAVSHIIGAGVIPAALEMIDQTIVDAVEPLIHAGLPRGAAAVLIIELEDLADGLGEETERIAAICRQHRAAEVRLAGDDAERALIWRARKEAVGAIGTISPSFYTQDGVIPRSKLPQVLAEIAEIAAKHRLLVANVFHAGDGNLHPLILYDSTDEDEIRRTHEAGREILRVCLREGGALSGEHGIGLEKAHLLGEVFDEATMAHMKDVRAVFNPAELLNPGKIFPTPGRCSETKAVRAKSGIAV